MTHRNDKEPNGPIRRFFEIKARADKRDGEKMVIGGYGAVFNRYTNMEWYAEVILPGFFDDIKTDRCACLFNHNDAQVLGRTKNQTLKLAIDANGLDYEATLPQHRADVYELISEGYVYESSFAFTTKEARWAELDRSDLVGQLPDADLDQLTYNGKITVRELVKGRELFDVSPVTYGAYQDTTTDTREARSSYEAWKNEQKPKSTEILTENTPEHRSRIAAALERAAQ